MVENVIRTKTSNVLNFGKGAMLITLETAKFMKNHTNHGFVLGCCMATLASGYAPMSQGWFELVGHGAVKNWKCL